MDQICSSRMTESVHFGLADTQSIVVENGVPLRNSIVHKTIVLWLIRWIPITFPSVSTLLSLHWSNILSIISSTMCREQDRSISSAGWATEGAGYRVCRGLRSCREGHWVKDGRRVASTSHSVITSDVFVGFKMIESPFQIHGGDVERENIVLACFLNLSDGGRPRQSCKEKEREKSTLHCDDCMTLCEEEAMLEQRECPSLRYGRCYLTSSHVIDHRRRDEAGNVVDCFGSCWPNFGVQEAYSHRYVPCNKYAHPYVAASYEAGHLE